MTYPRDPTEEEKKILEENHMNRDLWLVIFKTKRQIDFISKRSHRRRTVYVKGE